MGPPGGATFAAVRVRHIVALLAAAALAYLLAWPTGRRFAAFPAPPAPPPATGALAPNRALDDLPTLGTVGEGPGDVAVAADGTVYTGIADGHLLALNPGAAEWRPITVTYGRPLGLAFSPDERFLYVADAERGLMRTDREGHLEQLVDTLPDGRDLGLVGGLAVDLATGQVFFTSATEAWPLDRARDALLEHDPTGRLLRYDPRTRRTDVLAEGLQFANGVAVTPAGDAVLVAETGDYRIRRYGLRGADSARLTVWAGNLPGFPDGLNYDDRGLLWVSLVSPRNALLDDLLPRPRLRELVYRLPESLKPQPERVALAVALDADGRPVESLRGGANADGEERRFANVTNVVWRGDTAYLGTIFGRRVGMYVREAARGRPSTPVRE